MVTSKSAGKNERAKRGKEIISDAENFGVIADLASRFKDPEVLAIVQKIKQLNPEKASVDELLLRLRDAMTSYQTHIKDVEERENRIIELQENIAKKRIELEADKKLLEKERNEFEKEKLTFRKEESEMRGKSRIEKILYLKNQLQDQIVPVNRLIRLMASEGHIYTPETTPQEFEFLQLHAKQTNAFDITLKNHFIAQEVITRALIELELLGHKAEETKRLTGFKFRVFYRTRGILKMFLARVSPYENKMTKKKNPLLELVRLFGGLTPAITALASLDDQGLLLANDTFDKASAAFKNFSLEEKQTFMKLNWEPDFVKALDKSKRNDTWIQLSTIYGLSPAQVLAQIDRWPSENEMHRKNFLKLLSASLTPPEIWIVASEEIAKIRAGNPQ